MNFVYRIKRCSLYSLYGLTYEQKNSQVRLYLDWEGSVPFTSHYLGHNLNFTSLSFFAAVYNWRGDTRYGLPLEIGETVQILEECSGEFRGLNGNWSCRQNCSLTDSVLCYIPHGATAPSWPGPYHCQCFRITLRHITLGRTPLDEWSARRRELYLTTQHSQDRLTCPRAGFELTIPVRERLQTYALDRASTGIGCLQRSLYAFWFLVSERCTKLWGVRCGCNYVIVEFFPVHPMKAYGGKRGIVSRILNLDARWSKWSTSRPVRFTYREANLRYPLIRWVVGRFWRRENLLLLLGFETRTVQSVASRYADWAVPAPMCNWNGALITIACQIDSRKHVDNQSLEWTCCRG